MRRLQLFEFEDLAWFPASVRRAMTDFLDFMGGIEKPYRAFAGRLGRALDRTGDDTVLDLCSGGGGPALPIARLINRQRRQMRELIQGIDVAGYEWDIGRLAIPRTPASLTYLIGAPRAPLMGVPQ